MKTDKSVWIIPGLVGALTAALVTACGCGLSAMLATGAWAATNFIQDHGLHVTSDPGPVTRMGADIATYTSPDGYQVEYGVCSQGFTLVGYSAHSGASHMYLLQLNPNSHIGLDEMEHSLQQSSQTPDLEWMDPEMVTLEQKTVVIRGETHTLIVRQGGQGAEETYRMAMIEFTGKSGPALLAFSGSLAHWNMAQIEQFIAEMK